jgi:hypothetical protein
LLAILSNRRRTHLDFFTIKKSIIYRDNGNSGKNEDEVCVHATSNNKYLKLLGFIRNFVVAVFSTLTDVSISHHDNK